MLSEKDKKFLKELVKQELQAFEKDRVERDIFPQELAAEYNYEQYLKQLLKKL
jgi:hypothetical protein